MYAIGLSPDVEPKLISDEAPRALEPGGVLVLDGAKLASFETDNPYFETIQVDERAGNKTVNYAAVRNDVPYQPPRARIEASRT